ncbi:DUF421 domain-containing protein [Fluoribacter dumoffii]|uniref:Protein of uncharacterized function (DUF421) n=1 Tax=Fluoribacter dumoffii TaxID=463 RepID=A0A377G840_9GAMM|nr:YetF domain-containing protein [Fluoribacter dumoffii]KTC89800.1 hypothetical protein Ldum_0868 [Fluoribacter dumoffii NY 23]MCW8385096.1 DUF421 domain-containing protein [Fluoribacter dumoffii]MCW8418152.1 DUF421 domain-containing protein [Fluoribacter dumoffii]MCW8454006.1 DUF421 domain-containing protein [Fluoribacter dumoffii]MCW8461923.1 DUF421 domain-containing protein [Fluoribacter dumoffii]
MISYLYLINQDHNLIYIFIRGVLLFILCTLLLRFGNHRFKLNNSFDLVIVVILGGLISRGITGSATLISTLVALISLILMHKTIAICCRKYPSVENFFKGNHFILIKDGILQKKNLKKLNITEKDILEQLRQQLNLSSYKGVKVSYLERTGHISFVIEK